MTKTTAHHVERACPDLGGGGAVTPLEVTDSFWLDIRRGAFAHLGPGTPFSTRGDGTDHEPV